MYYDKKIESDVIKETHFHIGNAMVNKNRFAMPEQGPVTPEEENKHQTLMPHSHGRKNGIEVTEQKEPDIRTKRSDLAPKLKEPQGKPNMLGKSEDGMHSHFGHPDPHPMRLRHRKVSADPLHKEEDTLMDEWHDLYDKAKKGECTAQELARIQEIKGRVSEIAASRSSDAERILGIAFKSLDRAEAYSNIAKAEELLGGFQVEEEDLTESNDTSWQGKEVEYGDAKPDKIIPNNDGYKDQADHSESVWGSVPKDERVNIAEVDEVVKKATQVTNNVVNYFNKEWGTLEVKGDDGRYSDPLFYSKYAESVARKSFLAKHDLPGSPHWQHMTNGGGWGVKLNPKTGNFVAYQTEDGAMSKRQAQTEAVSRNKRHKKEQEDNDRIESDKIAEALKPADTNPLYREPRMRVH